MTGWFQWLLTTLPYLLLGGLSAALLADLLTWVHTSTTWLAALP